mmetsp:Transcript_110827/g.353160  ORF Transcript_110827/g.353160 Transcript_110827/m.353160 type:complete len:265 (+) Transcript_110827:5344-6138(+)
MRPWSARRSAAAGAASKQTKPGGALISKPASSPIWLQIEAPRTTLAYNVLPWSPRKGWSSPSPVPETTDPIAVGTPCNNVPTDTMYEGCPSSSASSSAARFVEKKPPAGSRRFEKEIVCITESVIGSMVLNVNFITFRWGYAAVAKALGSQVGASQAREEKVPPTSFTCAMQAVMQASVKFHCVSGHRKTRKMLFCWTGLPAWARSTTLILNGRSWDSSCSAAPSAQILKPSTWLNLESEPDAPARTVRSGQAGPNSMTPKGFW